MEHCSGHHINVGTEEDPATAKKGQSYYDFLLRSSIGGFINSFKREGESAKRWGHSPYGIYNRVILFTSLQILWVTVMTMLFGYKMILFHLIYF